MHPDVVAVAVGYGRNEAFGKATHGAGVNVYGFAKFNGTNVDYYNDVTVSLKLSVKRKLPRHRYITLTKTASR